MKKGRNQELLATRNAKIIERFIYWTEEQSMRADRALTLMSQTEFFISEKQIINVVREAYRKEGKKTRVVFHPPKPPKLTPEQKELLKKA